MFEGNFLKFFDDIPEKVLHFLRVLKHFQETFFVESAVQIIIKTLEEYLEA